MMSQPRDLSDLSSLSRVLSKAKPRIVQVIVVCLGLFALSLPCFAQSIEAVLLDTTLEPTPIMLTSLDHETVVYFDAQGEEHQRPLEEILRLDFPVDPMRIFQALIDQKDSGDEVHTLFTIDGQRFVELSDHSPLVFDSSDEETLIWESQTYGARVEVSLDDLFLLVFKSSISSAWPPNKDDLLVLVNGDRSTGVVGHASPLSTWNRLEKNEELTGFVEAIDEEGIHFIIGDTDDPVIFGFDRVMAVQIANDLQQPDASGVWVSSAYGSHFQCRIDRTQKINRDLPLELWLAPCLMPGVVEANRQEVMQLMNSAPMGLKPGEELYHDTITRLDFNLGEHHLLPLAPMPMTIVSGGEVFGVSIPPQVQPDGSITIHAPTTVTFELPEGAKRFHATAVLDLDREISDEQAAWAGFELVIKAGDTELARYVIDAEHPRHTINLAIPEGVGGLVFELDPAANGPILDRLRLIEPEVLVRRP